MDIVCHLNIMMPRIKDQSVRLSTQNPNNIVGDYIHIVEIRRPLEPHFRGAAGDAGTNRSVAEHGTNE